MVVGNGMIAKEFENYREDDSVIIFASGVSDSTSTDSKAFEREEKLITETQNAHKEKLFVYFSTCSIDDHSMLGSAYVNHKIKMEDLVMNNHTPFIIFRLTNPIGRTNNTHTVVNYFIKNVREYHEFVVWKNAKRNLIDIDDLYLICNHILQQGSFKNSVVNIANPENYPVSFIVNSIEKYFSITGNYTLLDKGGAPAINTAAIEPLFRKFNISFDEHYLDRLLQKYFPKNSSIL
jgi:nucleoside-diphosphate-sugar epimerase